MKQETKRLYLDDTYQTEFEAQVVDKEKREKGTAAILDQTCFYPESGGQPSDRGQIDGIDVIHVLEENGRIIHILEKKIEAGSVKGKVHWETRFDHMQQHSGQHILSQSFSELLEAERGRSNPSFIPLEILGRHYFHPSLAARFFTSLTRFW